jgi:hypothetical protein
MRSDEGEGPYPTVGVGYPRLTLLRPLAARVPREFIQSLGRYILSTFATSFAKKWGYEAPEGDLVFGGKPSRPLALLIR